jgi:hypothetical protein
MRPLPVLLALLTRSAVVISAVLSSFATAANATPTLVANDALGTALDGTFVVYASSIFSDPHDLTITDVASGASTTLVGVDQKFWDIQDGIVVFQQSTGHTPDNGAIRTYDLSTGILSGPLAFGTGGTIDSGRVAFQVWDGNDYEIALLDLASGITSQLTSNAVDDIEPSLSGQRIAFRSGDGVTDLMLLDLVSSSVTSVAANVGDIDLFDNWLAWEDGSLEMSLLNLDNGQTVALGDGDDPSVGESFVVWEERLDNGGAYTGRLCAYELSTGDHACEASGGERVGNPRVSGSLAAYTRLGGSGHGSLDVLYTEITFVPEPSTAFLLLAGLLGMATRQAYPRA